MLSETLKICRDRVQAYQGTGITEQDTKNAIIEPLLEALGWPKQDLSRVRAEYRHTAGDNPVDYALLDASRPLVFVEAKALDVDLDERKFVLQVLTYANAARVDWALLTNGARWALYDVFDKTELSDRKVFDVRLEEATAPAWLGLVLPAAVREGRLRRLRTFMKDEARVHDAVQDLLNAREPAFIRLLAERTRLDPRAVATALGTFRISLSRSPIADMLEQVAQSEVVERPVVDLGASAPTQGGQAVGTRRPARSDRKRPESQATPQPDTHQPEEHLPSAANLPESIRTFEDAARTSVPEGRGPRRSVPDGPMRPAETGARPSALVTGRQRWPVSSWKQLGVETFKYLSRHDPARYEALFDHPELRGRSRSPVTRSPEGHLAPTAVPGGYVDTNLSAANMITLLNRVIRLVDPDLKLDWA